MLTKVCKGCGEEKPVSEFYKSSDNKSGYNRFCKPCYRDYMNKYNKIHEKDSTHRAARLLDGARTRNEEVTITKEWIKDKIDAGVCEVTGIRFDMSQEKPARSFTPSLDRKDPSKGYTNDNTQVVVWIYNRAKGVHSHDDVLTLAEALTNGRH